MGDGVRFGAASQLFCAEMGSVQQRMKKSLRTIVRGTRKGDYFATAIVRRLGVGGFRAEGDAAADRKRACVVEGGLPDREGRKVTLVDTQSR